jgi:hypothetical protein
MGLDPGGRRLAVRFSLPEHELRDAALELYDVASGKRLTRTIIDHGGWNTKGRSPICAISPKGDSVAYLTNASRVQFIPIPPHMPKLPNEVYVDVVHKNPRDWVWHDAAGNGLFVFYAGDHEYSLRWWDLSKASARGVASGHEVFRAEMKAMKSTCVALNADAGLFAIAIEPENRADGNTPVLQIWTLNTKPVKSEITLPDRATALAIAPEGRRIAVGFPNGSIGFYDRDTKKAVKHNRLPAAFSVSSVTYHPSGKYVACSTFDS